MTELQSLYLKKLEKMANIESQLLDALPKMIENATSMELKEGLSNHLEETQVQHDRLMEIFKSHKHSMVGNKTKDAAFEMMIAESEKEISGIRDANLKDVAIIAAAQSVEHIEMARYGTLVSWAKELEYDEDADLLDETLSEEKEADKLLSGIGEGGIFSSGINEMAAKR